MNDDEALVKIVLIGDAGAGKSSLLGRLRREEFGLSKPTIGVEFACVQFNCEGKVIKGQFWDTTGQDKYQEMISAYFKGVHAVLLVFDVTNKRTFDHLPTHLARIREADPHVPIIVCGTKTELTRLRKVAWEDAQAMCEREGLLYMEASAALNKNVVQVFEALAKEAYAYKVRQQ